MTNQEKADLSNLIRNGELKSIKLINKDLKEKKFLSYKSILLKNYKQKSCSCTKMLLLINTTRISDFDHIKNYRFLKDLNNRQIKQLINKGIEIWI